MQKRTCVRCGAEYSLYKGKPGFVNECKDCGLESEEGLPRFGGNMIYSHKTAGEIQILSLDSAKHFANLARRIGKRSNLGRARSTEK
jgi:hypothetical protein